ncbi:MAG: DNA-3-methyladenine glycosylase [Myxococcales bacterium]|nr:DNA-3-methyladenine glycosylase [Myxococcales bacterium]
MSLARLLGARLPPDFFALDVLALGRALVGQVLVHASAEGLVAARIVETEAYRGPEDLAAHSAGGRRTRRTEAMFGPAGRVYMFRLYGTSWAFNVVAGAVGEPLAVLVRAVEPLVGLELMAVRRRREPGSRELTNGPGKLTAALGLEGRHYGADLRSDELFLAEGAPPGRGRLGRSARVNVDYAGAWAARPWRFFERGNRYVSVRPRE